MFWFLGVTEEQSSLWRERLSPRPWFLPRLFHATPTEEAPGPQGTKHCKKQLWNGVALGFWMLETATPMASVSFERGRGGPWDVAEGWIQIWQVTRMNWDTQEKVLLQRGGVTCSNVPGHKATLGRPYL